MKYKVQITQYFASKFEARYAEDPGMAEALSRLWSRLEVNLPYPRRAVGNTNEQWTKWVREPLDDHEWDLMAEVEVVIENGATRVRLMNVGKAPHGGLLM